MSTTVPRAALKLVKSANAVINAHRAQHDVAVQAYQLQEACRREDSRSGPFRPAASTEEENECGRQHGALPERRARAGAECAEAVAHDQDIAREHIREVADDGHRQGTAALLPTQEPTEEHEVRQGDGGGPDPAVEVLPGLPPRPLRSRRAGRSRAHGAANGAGGSRRPPPRRARASGRGRDGSSTSSRRPTACAVRPVVPHA